jgi:hypothetical protein
MTQYYFVLGVVTLMTVLAINITRGRIGRLWKSVRDMDIAAELVGINLMKAKLMAFFVSSYIVGVSGALFVFLWRGAAEAELFDVQTFLPGAVHRHHRGAGLDPRQLSRRDPDRCAAGASQRRAAVRSACRSARPRSNTSTS